MPFSRRASPPLGRVTRIHARALHAEGDASARDEFFHGLLRSPFAVQTEWKKWCSKWSLRGLRGLRKWSLHFWAQLFEGRLALNPGLNLTRVSFSYVQKHFLG